MLKKNYLQLIESQSFVHRKKEELNKNYKHQIALQIRMKKVTIIEITHSFQIN
jgi:hypothetical protein